MANGCAVDTPGQPSRQVGVQRCGWKSHFQIIPLAMANPFGHCSYGIPAQFGRRKD